TLPKTDYIISNGSNNMTINAFTSDPSGNGVLDGSGSQIINVGATLNVKAGQATGLYTSGTGFTVMVNYN
ncbi:MAG: DUF4402 domain-containing protein, partial [Bacteroidota bacterium]|nr:DUF4402 domain-containing protein [Bacteroidota bacterium]